MTEPRSPPMSLAECWHELRRGRSPRALWDSWIGVALETRLDQQIYEAGDPADDVYLLLDGWMCVRTGDAERQIGLVLGAPGLWGDVELLAGESTRASSLDAVGVARLLRFDADALSDARRRADFAESHAKDLALRLHRTMLAGGGTWRTLEQRVLHLLDVFGSEPDPRSPQRLARITGASVKAVQRTLARIERGEIEGEETSSFVHRICVDDAVCAHDDEA